MIWPTGRRAAVLRGRVGVVLFALKPTLPISHLTRHQPPDRDSLALLLRRGGVFLLPGGIGGISSGGAGHLVGARLAVQEAALLVGAVGLFVLAVVGVLLLAVVGLDAGCVGDVLGHGVLQAHGARVDAVALARLGHGVVAAVEVLALLLEVLGEVVRSRRQLAVQPEEALLLGGEGLWFLES